MRELSSIKLVTFVKSSFDAKDYEADDQWFPRIISEFGDRNHAIAISQIAKLADRHEELVLATARRLWDQSMIEVVPVNLAVGIGDGIPWHCGVTTTEAQLACYALVNCEKSYGNPDEILVIRNGVDGPVVIGHYCSGKDYQPYTD